MVWIYERDNHRVEFAIRHEKGSDSYAVTCRFPGGRTMTDVFVTLRGFCDYLETLESELVADGWNLVDAPRRRRPVGWDQRARALPN